MERVEKIFPMRLAVEEIPNLFLDCAGFVHYGNVAPEYQSRLKCVFEMHDVAPCHNRSYCAGIHDYPVSLRFHKGNGE